MQIKELEKIKQENFGAFKVIASYLNEFPCLVTKEIMDEIISDSSLDEESYFALFLSLALSENDESGDVLNKQYLSKSVKKLDPDEYKSNPYYKNIKIPQKRSAHGTSATRLISHMRALFTTILRSKTTIEKFPK